MEPEGSFMCSQEPATGPYSEPDESNTHPISLRCIFISSSHLRHCLPTGLFRSGFPTKILYASLISRVRSICLTHLILTYLITPVTFGELYRSWSFSLYEGRLKSSWTRLITPSRNFVEVRWRSLFRVPPLASDALLTTFHPLLENVLQTIDHFGCSDGVPPIHFFQAEDRIQFRSHPMRFLWFSSHEKGVARFREVGGAL
jgi:hypothetical protein